MLTRRLAALVLAASLAFSTPAAFAGDSERDSLLALEARWNEAIRVGDAATVATILAPDFILIFQDAPPSDRAAVLAATAAPGRTIEQNGSRDQVVRVHGDTAVITGVYFERGVVSGNHRYAMENRYTDVFARVGNGWIAVSAHASRLSVTVEEAE